MKTFLGAWFGTLIAGWLGLNIFGLLFDFDTGFFLLIVTIIALFITLISAQFDEIGKLEKRIERLEQEMLEQVVEAELAEESEK